MQEQPYPSFFSLPPLSLAEVERRVQNLPKNEAGLRTSIVCYLFVFDDEERLGCRRTTGSLLEQIPRWNIEADSGPGRFMGELCAFAYLGGRAAYGWDELIPQLAAPQSRFALCVLAPKERLEPALLPGGEPWRSAICAWQGFRAMIPRLSEPQQGLLARARELMYFDAEFRFCSRCASRLTRLEKEFGKACPNCSELFFPRQDPSVIALICHSDSSGEWLLLGHNHRFRSGLYSLIAGFVEAGEELEQALQREAWEEAGVRLERVQYLCSQAWPQPHSLMNGFLAYSVDLPKQSRPDGVELASLLWLERRDVQAAAEHKGDADYPLASCRKPYIYKGTQSQRGEATGFRLPGHGTIARRLIERWAKGRSWMHL